MIIMTLHHRDLRRGPSDAGAGAGQAGAPEQVPAQEQAPAPVERAGAHVAGGHGHGVPGGLQLRAPRPRRQEHSPVRRALRQDLRLWHVQDPHSGEQLLPGELAPLVHAGAGMGGAGASACTDVIAWFNLTRFDDGVVVTLGGGPSVTRRDCCADAINRLSLAMFSNGVVR